MLRDLSLLALVIGLGCGGDAPKDATGGDPTLPVGDSDTPTLDTGSEPTTDPWGALLAPPTDVVADCWSWAAEVDDATGEPTLLSLGTYDPGTLSLLSSERDWDPDRVMDNRFTYLWDAAFENILRFDYDYDADGQLDYTIEQVFDPVSGLRTEYREDADGDGVPDEIWAYFYDVDRLVEIQADTDADGVVDSWLRYTYDAEDRPLTIEGDDGDDGTVDYLYQYVHDDVPVGRSFTVTYDDDMDGLPEVTERYAYDALDQRTHYAFANDLGDDTTSDYTYTADGDLATYASRAIYEGVFNDAQYAAYTYASPGRRSQRLLELDFDDDAVPEVTFRETWTWDCP